MSFPPATLASSHSPDVQVRLIKDFKVGKLLATTGRWQDLLVTEYNKRSPANPRAVVERVRRKVEIERSPYKKNCIFAASKTFQNGLCE